MTKSNVESVNIELPEKFIFSVELQVRLHEVTGGVHLGNHFVVSYCNEALMLFLRTHGFPELRIDGASIINVDLLVLYASESLHGHILKVDIAFGPLKEAGFNVYFKVFNLNTGKMAAKARMTLYFFDYQRHKITRIPKRFREIVENQTNLAKSTA